MIRVIRHAVPLVGLGLVIGFIGCNRDRTKEGQPGTTTVTGANLPSVANTTAIDRIVAARCARELTCNNVGSNKHYKTSNECSDKIRSDMKDDLSTNDCPGGVSQKQLDACVTAIKAESCGNALDKIDHVTSCRTSDLCLKSAQR